MSGGDPNSPMVSVPGPNLVTFAGIGSSGSYRARRAVARVGGHKVRASTSTSAVIVTACSVGPPAANAVGTARVAVPTVSRATQAADSRTSRAASWAGSAPSTTMITETSATIVRGSAGRIPNGDTIQAAGTASSSGVYAWTASAGRPA